MQQMRADDARKHRQVAHVEEIFSLQSEHLYPTATDEKGTEEAEYEKRPVS